MTTRFFLCKRCGNVIIKIVDSGVVPVCCGEEMVELRPNRTDVGMEKHVPVVECKCGGCLKVKVGSLPHPMSEEHHISFIYVETENGGQIRWLDPEGKAEAEFRLGKEKPIAVYEYCNIHGLWKADLTGKC
ncbi:MAG: desulfoferrodoxin [Bacteroidales bacterium]|nr:desulfoferrodoxin [Bacteroidales bacterium]